MKNFLGAFILLVVLWSAKIYSQELSGFAQVQLRYYPLSPLDERQEGTGFSLAIQPELYYDFVVVLIAYYSHSSSDMISMIRKGPITIFVNYSGSITVIIGK
ncbi:MAG: hypothetical protein IH795_01415 [Bacteroidetes bacterium]|nr:hypothetical protein [Bacteroidota bacterium]